MYSGIVQKGGGQAGSVYNMPTANIFIHESQHEFGVYAAIAEFDGRRREAISCLRQNQKNELILESHLFDFEGDLYDEELNIELLEKLSDLVPFESIDQMREKMQNDLRLAKQFFDVD